MIQNNHILISVTFPYDFPESVPSIILEKENGFSLKIIIFSQLNYYL